MSHRFPFNRPLANAQGKRLFYVTNYIDPMTKVDTKRFRIASMRNIHIQIKLYQWHRNNPLVDDIQQSILIEELFGGAPQYSANTTGKIIAKVIPYRPLIQRPVITDNVQRIRSFWRFNDPLDLRFGLEFMMYVWMPVLYDDMKTDGDFQLELDAMAEKDYDFSVIMQNIAEFRNLETEVKLF